MSIRKALTEIFEKIPSANLMLHLSLMSIGQKIRELRKEKGWSQGDLGKKVGVHPQYLSAWETDSKTPSAEALIKLSRALNVSIDYLLLDNVPKEGTHKIDDFELYQLFRQAETLPSEEKNSIAIQLSALVFRQKVRLAEKQTKEKNFPETAEPKNKPQPRPLPKVVGKR